MMRNAIIALFFSFPLLLSAQDLNLDLKYYADIVTNVESYDHKIRANDELVLHVEKALESSQADLLNEVKWISNVAPADSTFQIYSWQLQKSEDAHEYHGYIVFSDGSYKKLNDNSKVLLDDYEYMTANADNWFGQLYYNIKEFEIEGKSVYLLFGFNGFNKYENIKIAEILQFDDQNNPSFGMPIFTKEGEDERHAKQRILLQYSDDSNVNLNFNPGLKLVLYDHLVGRMGMQVGQGPTMVGDGSYEAYEYKKGKFTYIEKVFDHIYESAPVPNPVLNESKKDIIGN